MKITLANVDYELPGGSRYPVFKADLLIDGIHAGTAWNPGYGAATNIDPINEQGSVLIKRAEVDCRRSELAFKNEESYGEFWITRTLALTVEQRITGHIFLDEDATPEVKRQHELARTIAQLEENKIDPAVQMQRDMLVGVLVGKPDFYYVHDFPLARLMDHPETEKVLVPELMKIHNRLGGGNMVLNTNIPERWLRKAGFSARQYVATKAPPLPKKSTAKRKGKRL